jgi:nucleoside-diphosphate-sugar epimerase
MNSMRVLVIGGTRLSGPDIVGELLEHGCLPAVLHRGEHERPLPARVRHFHGNARDIEFLRYVAREFQPTAVIHMWAMHPADIEAVASVFERALEKFVMVSSGDVYAAFEAMEQGATSYQPLPIPEDAPLRTGPYPVHDGVEYDKIGAERAAIRAFHARRLPSVIVRYPAVYGPGPVREWYWVKRIRDGRRRIALPDGGLNIFHRGFTANLAHAVVLALLRAQPGSIYNAGDQPQFTVRQLTELVAEALNHQWEIVPVPAEAWPHGTPYSLTPGHLIYDLTRIREELGYTDIVSPQEALRVTVEYLAYNKPERVTQIAPGAFDYKAEDAVIERYK